MLNTKITERLEFYNEHFNLFVNFEGSTVVEEFTNESNKIRYGVNQYIIGYSTGKWVRLKEFRKLKNAKVFKDNIISRLRSSTNLNILP